MHIYIYIYISHVCRDTCRERYHPKWFNLPDCPFGLPPLQRTHGFPHCRTGDLLAEGGPIERHTHIWVYVKIGGRQKVEKSVVLLLSLVQKKVLSTKRGTVEGTGLSLGTGTLCPTIVALWAKRSLKRKVVFPRPPVFHDWREASTKHRGADAPFQRLLFFCKKNTWRVSNPEGRSLKQEAM